MQTGEGLTTFDVSPIILISENTLRTLGILFVLFPCDLQNRYTPLLVKKHCGKKNDMA